MVEKQLIILLYVIVSLVFVEVVYAVVVGVHIPAGVVAAAVFFHFFFAGVIPGMVSAFFTAERYQFDGGVVVVIPALQVVRVQPD